MTYEQITGILDKRDRAYKTELADLEQRIAEAKAASEKAEAALDAATRSTDPDAYRKAKREAAYHNDALEMLIRRREQLHYPPLSQEEFKEMTAFVQEDFRAEMLSCVDWAVETGALGKKYADELLDRKKQANAMLWRLSKAAGEVKPDLRNAGMGLDAEKIGFLLRSMYSHGWYEDAATLSEKEASND